MRKIAAFLGALTFPAGLLLSQSNAVLPANAGFPGGNIVVQRVEGHRVFVAPDLRDTQKGQWWFYWNFRLKPAGDTPFEIVFTGKDPIGVRGPAASFDGGETWRWLGANSVRQTNANGSHAWSFEAGVPAGAAEARFAFCPQYLQSHLESWLARRRGDPALRVEELCKSRKGRGVEMLRAGCLDPAKSKGIVLLTSRHHCCETMATYAMEGLLDAALADDDTGRRWRENWEIIAIPFMDKDGVEDGDQGKNRTPHDHNRDYNANPIYPEVAALMALGEKQRSRVIASLDLHCPFIRGEWNDRVYIVGSSDTGCWQNQKSFAEIWERVQQGPVRFRPKDCLAFGTAWNTTNNFSQGRSCTGWARDTFADARLVTGIEIAYADALGVEVNASTARALGRDLARALADFLAPAR